MHLNGMNSSLDRSPKRFLSALDKWKQMHLCSAPPKLNPQQKLSALWRVFQQFPHFQTRIFLMKCSAEKWFWIW